MTLVLVLLLVVAVLVVAVVVLRPRLRYNLEVAALALPGLRTDDGLRTAEVAGAIADDEPTARRVLQKLADSGYVEQVPGTRPERWRLTAATRSLVDGPDIEQRRR